MSRLIDADKLLTYLKDISIGAIPINGDGSRDEFNTWLKCMEVVKEQPTAFDVDKVVEQLEKSHFHTDATFDDDGYCNDDSEEVVNLNEAIEIVRSGGLDD